MRLLLDTHAFLWWLDGDKKLIKHIRDLVADEANDIYVSAASALEISTKVRIGKLPGAKDVAEMLPRCVSSQGFSPLEISITHAQYAGLLPGPHRDPFDRMIAAQAQIENLPVVSRDDAFDRFGIRRLWSRASLR